MCILKAVQRQRQQCSCASGYDVAAALGGLQQPTLDGVLSRCGACQGYLFTEAAPSRSFELVERSTFTLAPRGSGSGSFRMYEALQLGSIPIFIWGERAGGGAPLLEFVPPGSLGCLCWPLAVLMCEV